MVLGQGLGVTRGRVLNPLPSLGAFLSPFGEPQEVTLAQDTDRNQAQTFRPAEGHRPLAWGAGRVSVITTAQDQVVRVSTQTAVRAPPPRVLAVLGLGLGGPRGHRESKLLGVQLEL